MRTPNTACLLCGKPLYRRPYELARIRYAACMEHRSQAQSVVGVTEAQWAGLSLGAKKGTNYRTGYKHREESKAKVAASNRAFYAANPGVALARARRGEDSPNWRGGTTRLNTAIRLMSEYRRWMEAVKTRDGKCLRCGETKNLEAHHKIELADIVERLDIRSRDNARAHPELWDVGNGETLCQSCHYAEHGRDQSGLQSDRYRKPKECPVCGMMFLKRGATYCGRECRDAAGRRRGPANPNWKGGLVAIVCRHCNRTFYRKRAEADSKFCSRNCVNENRRTHVRSPATASSNDVPGAT